MDSGTDIDLAPLASLVGEPVRSRMLALLMSGEARTAGELSIEGGVAASTASSHLARLVDGGLVTVVAQGRHRYFRLAGADVAAALESLMCVAAGKAGNAARHGPRDAGLRAARVCYDHLAGAAGVRLLEAMRGSGYVVVDDHGALTPDGRHWCATIDIDLEALARGRRPLCRPCLDWSERRDHLAGAIGAAILQRLLERGDARRVPDSRAVSLSARGERFVERLA